MRKPAGTVRSMRWYPDDTPVRSWKRSWRWTVNPELVSAEPLTAAPTDLPSSVTGMESSAPLVPATT